MQDQHPRTAADEQQPAFNREGTSESVDVAARPEVGAADAPSAVANQDEYEYDDEESEEGVARSGYVRFRTPVFAVVATILSLALLALIAGNVYQFVHNRNAQVVATVNGAQITQRDFNRSDANSQQVLDQLISEKLIQQEAKRQKVTIPDSQINGQINTIKTQLGTEKDFQAALQRNNLTENQLRDQIRTQLLAEQLGAKGVTVSDSDAQTYYNQNKAQYGTQTFDQAKDSIKSTLLQQKQSDAIQTWVAGLRKNAKVVIRLPT